MWSKLDQRLYSPREIAVAPGDRRDGGTSARCRLGAATVFYCVPHLRNQLITNTTTTQNQPNPVELNPTNSKNYMV